MSKAFTREDAGVGEEPLAPPPRPAGTRYVTPEGWRSLAGEATALAARPLATLSPEEVRRLRHLDAVLDALKVVDTPPPDTARVFFGAWVTLEDEEGREVRYRLVGPDEADARQGRLSVESPLARALLGKEEGDEVQVQRPGGAVAYTLVAVGYRPPEG